MFTLLLLFDTTSLAAFFVGLSIHEYIKSDLKESEVYILLLAHERVSVLCCIWVLEFICQT
jgi:hypothetical protein